MADIRFGRAVDEMPEQLEFGAWGLMDTTAAMDVFQDTHAWFDQEDVIKAEEQRREMILAARRYYDGYHVKPLKVRPGEPDDNVLVNFCRSLIDDSVSWLFGNPETGILQMRIGEKNSAGGDAYPDDELIAQVYEESGGFNFFKRLGMRGSVAGHFFVKIMPRESDTPRLVVLDPLLITIRTDPTDAERVIAYKIEWRREESDLGSRRKDTYIYRQLVVEASQEDGAWVVGNFKTKDRAKRQWQLVDAWAWPWKWAPIVDGPNLEPGWGYYGLSDLEDVASINDGINFLASNTMRILKFHAHPKTVGTGMEADELQETAIDSFWTVPNPEARIVNLEMQSDLHSSMAFLEFLKVSFWTIGRGLDPAVYKDKIGQVTNFALRVLAIRTLHKSGDKRLTYGKALRTINERVLEMTGREVQETLIQWPEPLPEDPNEALSRLEREVALDVTSRETASEEIGRAWKIEQKRIRAEKKERVSLGEYLVGEFERGNASPFQPRGGRQESDSEQEQ
jgi:hypothetical protein